MENAQSILVVDDEPGVRTLVARMLRGRGFEVMEARNGLEAVQVYGFYHSEIKLVITDIDMPVMDGLEAITRMKEIDPDVHVLIISGRLEAGRCPSGVFALPKPFAPAQLLEAVKLALGRR